MDPEPAESPQTPDSLFQTALAKRLTFWLAKREPMIRDAICEAADEAIERWLDEHTEEILDRIATEIAKRVPSEGATGKRKAG